MKLYNSLTRKVEEFVPLNPPRVGMYTCGPTVYDYPTIGNYRTYTTADFLLRALKYEGYEVKYVMNLTDVGHLTGDNQGDADTGEDRLEKAAKRENKTAWDVAAFYSEDFLSSLEKLNLTKPDIVAAATKHITEQIALIQKLEQNGFTYRIDDGIYFDVKAYEETGKKYGELSTLDKIQEGARVEPNPEKKDPRDFALWKFSYAGGRSFDTAQDGAAKQRHMEWESPWGVGFPGWHIECSAMGMKYLGEQFDIHTGGEDLRSTHHPNEIAQSEGATGKSPFVRYWLHGAFLTVDGGRMGKSLGNAYTLHDLKKRGFDPLDLRYFYLSGHYRKQINFTWESLEGAKAARAKLMRLMTDYKNKSERTSLSTAKLGKVNDFQGKFKEALSEDLNMPQALAVVWEVIKSNIPDYDKYDLLISFDEVLGLGLNKALYQAEIPLPSGSVLVTEEVVADDIVDLVNMRETARQMKDFTKSDQIRKQIEEKGYSVKDLADKVIISRK